MKRFVQITIVVLLLVLSGCGGEQQSAQLPTLAVFPTLTPSSTFTNTPTPTNTFTPTATSTATNTATPTATLTFTPSKTFTPSITPTFTLTPTATRTPTPTATNTPVPTSTPNTPQIGSFTVNTTNVTGNATITFSWVAEGDAVQIQEMTAQGQVLRVFPPPPDTSLPASGSYSVVVPGGQGSMLIYRLVVARAGQQAHVDLAITVQCPIPWFFGNQRAPAGSGCPTGTQIIGNGAYQAFQRGVMIFANNTVYGLVYQQTTQSGVFLAYPNGWDGSTVYTCAGTPPSGLFAAQGVIGWAYCNTNGPGATWHDPGGALGWAVTQEDTSARILQTSNNGMIFIDTPVGAVYRLTPGSPGSPGGTWGQVP